MLNQILDIPFLIRSDSEGKGMSWTDKGEGNKGRKLVERQFKGNERDKIKMLYFIRFQDIHYP